MSYITLQIQQHDYLIQKSIDEFDMQQILGVLGFSQDAIAQASITVLQDSITVQWTTIPNSIAS